MLGGIVGQISGDSDLVQNCYSKSSITSNDVAAGLVGIIDGTSTNASVLNCYNSNNNISANKVGGAFGIINSATPIISNTYYLSKEGMTAVGELNQSITIYCVGKTIEEMKTSEFKDLLGNTIWNISLDSSINEGLAYLIENVPN